MHMYYYTVGIGTYRCINHSPVPKELTPLTITIYPFITKGIKLPVDVCIIHKRRAHILKGIYCGTMGNRITKIRYFRFSKIVFSQVFSFQLI